jgi:hypothetical protein
MKIQPVKVWQARVVTRDELAVDDKGSHAFNARQGDLETAVGPSIFCENQPFMEYGEQYSDQY